MIDIDILLTPIRADAPAGDDLRYDPVFDQIKEAREEDDPTLPAGSWGRQAKRADVPLVLRLTTQALTTRSKDLWLAAWWGHAALQTDGLVALPSVLRLLLALHEQYPETLYPEVEDGDTSLRAAPLQWGLEQYATLLRDLPSVAPNVSYSAYKEARLRGSAEAADALNASLAATEKKYLVGVDAQLSEARQELEALHLYCEGSYGQDGPSFARFRKTLEEVRGLVGSLLRERLLTEPDEPEPQPEAVQASVADQVASAPATEIEDQPARAPDFPAMQELENAATGPSRSPDTPIKEARGTRAGAPQNSEEVWQQVAEAARVLMRNDAADPAGYLLLATRCWSQVAYGARRADAPTSELRLQLSTLRREERWAELLVTAIESLAIASASRWLDVHRDVYLAANQTGAAALAASAVDMVKLLLGAGVTARDCFDDETPIASEETRQWIASQVLPEVVSGTVAVEIDSVPLQVQAETREIAPSASTGEQMFVDVDLFAQATTLASAGDLSGAVQLLTANAESVVARRNRFFRRLEIARLCMVSGVTEIARQVLEQLRSEVAERDVVLWEGAHVGAEVLVLLLKCHAKDGADDAAIRAEMMSELCSLDPFLALQMQGRR